MTRGAKTKAYHYDLMTENRNKIAKQAQRINEGLRTLHRVTLVPDSVPPNEASPIDCSIPMPPTAIDERLRAAIEAIEEEDRMLEAKKTKYA